MKKEPCLVVKFNAEKILHNSTYTFRLCLNDIIISKVNDWLKGRELKFVKILPYSRDYMPTMFNLLPDNTPIEDIKGFNMFSLTNPCVFDNRFFDDDYDFLQLDSPEMILHSKDLITGVCENYHTTIEEPTTFISIDVEKLSLCIGEGDVTPVNNLEQFNHLSSSYGYNATTVYIKSSKTDNTSFSITTEKIVFVMGTPCGRRYYATGRQGSNIFQPGCFCLLIDNFTNTPTYPKPGDLCITGGFGEQFSVLIEATLERPTASPEEGFCVNTPTAKPNVTFESVLDIAKRLVGGDRQTDYGHPNEGMATIAAVWSVYLKKPVTASDVAMLMALLKICRSIQSPLKRDNLIDCAGYIHIADLCNQDTKVC